MATQYSIVAAVDGSRASRAAVMWAAREAERRQTSLFVVHICEYGNTSLWPSPSLEQDLRAFVRPIVDEAVALAEQTAPSTPVTGTVMVGPTTRMLLGLTEHAELLVMGRSGKGALARHLIGSLTARMAAHARCPMVAVPAVDPQSADVVSQKEPGKVVVGVGDRPTNGAAIRFAMTEADTRRTAVLAVHAWHGPDGLPLDPDAPPPHPMYREDTERETVQRRIDEALPDIPTRTAPKAVVRAGQPGGVLVSLCEPGDLLVLGQHRHEAQFTPATIGQVVGDGLQHAPCAVAVVPEPIPVTEKVDPPRVAETAGLISY